MRTTATGLLRIAHIPTGTRIHSSHERESTRIPTTHIDTIDRDLTIFKGLSECFEDMLIELEKLVEKEDSLMGE